MRPPAPQRPNVWTCSAGLVDVLAQKLLAGFPLAPDAKPDLAAVTVLVPTRRAARALEDSLFHHCGVQAVLLPKVRPIGDVDDDLLAEHLPNEGVDDAISRMGQLFLMLRLIDEWASDNPQLPLAANVNASRSQALGLAQSLVDLVAQLETEEVEARHLSQTFATLDLAEHRLTIVSLLDLVQEQLPKRLHEMKLMGPAARRNVMLRLEARRLAEGGMTGPVIAAGSTGTNPATRALLKAIARHPQGAVVLPGLDLSLDEDSWNVVTPNHPQYSMKLLLSELEIRREDVQELAPASARQALLREVMRPADTTEKWADRTALPLHVLREARAGLRLIEAPDRHIEARSIALLLRQTLEQSGKRAALVTPDRNLGQQVTAELSRWQAAIDDSGGEPLIRFGRAQLCKLLIDCVEADFSPTALVALLAHPLVTLGLQRDAAQRLSHLFELALLRQDLPPQGPTTLIGVCARVKSEIARDVHAHPLLAGMDEAGWGALSGFVQRLASALVPLPQAPPATLQDHVAVLDTALAALAPETDEADPFERSFVGVMEALRRESQHHPVSSFRRALTSIVWALRQETMRRIPSGETRLAIFGLAEARMIDADLVVLGGLNEGIWPATVDPGPWVNRSMRTSLALAQPERDIGITAHDLAQGLMHPNVVVTWSARVGTTPMMPARWVLRLRALMEAVGIKTEDQTDATVPLLAQRIDEPNKPTPLAMPRPKPAVHLRPTRFSVTEIEKLIRDPYAVFARRILKLEPLPALAGDLEPRLRGSLFHAALSHYVQRRERGLAFLVADGEAMFATYMLHPEVRHFWWPRFKRMAKAFVEEDDALCAAVTASFVEQTGKLKFPIDGVEHTLSARADRIDVLAGRKLRLIDYKTGAPPSARMVISGLNPQLTLEAAIASGGGFADGLPLEVDDLLYIRISGSKPPVEVASLTQTFAKENAGLEETVTKHFARLKDLLARYRNADQAYIPRAVLHTEREASDYDHLSRFAEWSRGGT